MKTNLFRWSCYILLLAFTSCKSCRKDILPDATQSGAGTFGCKINGQIWIPNKETNGFGGGGAINARYIDSNNPTFPSSLWLITSDNNGNSIILYVNNLPNGGLGTYLLNENTGIRPAELSPKNYMYVVKENKPYTTNNAYKGSMTITNVTSTGIISGTFEGTAYYQNGETVKITEGRFDVRVN